MKNLEYSLECHREGGNRTGSFMKTAGKISRIERQGDCKELSFASSTEFLKFYEKDHMSVVRIGYEDTSMIGHVWNGAQGNHSSPKIRLRLNMALYAWFLCILSIHLSHVQSRNTRHHTLLQRGLPHPIRTPSSEWSYCLRACLTSAGSKAAPLI
jgi:hypothetical protein